MTANRSSMDIAPFGTPVTEFPDLPAAMEAVQIPSVERLREVSWPASVVASQLVDTSEWAGRIFQPEWAPATPELRAASRILDGADAVVGRWVAPNGEDVSFVATLRRLHVRLALPAADPLARLGGAFARSRVLAEEVFGIRFAAGEYDVVKHEGWIAAFTSPRFQANWNDGMLIVTDGMGVKYTFNKVHGREGGLKQESARPGYVRWFVRK